MSEPKVRYDTRKIIDLPDGHRVALENWIGTEVIRISSAPATGKPEPGIQYGILDVKFAHVGALAEGLLEIAGRDNKMQDAIDSAKHDGWVDGIKEERRRQRQKNRENPKTQKKSSGKKSTHRRSK